MVRLLLSLALCLLSLTSVAAAGLTDILVTSTNSTAFVFSVVFDGVTAGSPLTVLIQPADGNATETKFPTIASPMEVVVSNLQPDTLFTFTFSLTDSSNASASSTFPAKTVRTHRLGPAIIGFFAQDPSAGTNANDAQFSAGDTITIQFGDDTNQPGPLANKAGVDALLTFSQPIGSAYHGSWVSASTLVITIDDAGQSDPKLGYLFVQVIGNLLAADGKSDVSVSSSPPLIGSWANQDGAFTYFRPTNADGTVIASPDFKSYDTTTTVNTALTLPMSLTFPTTAPNTGYMVSVTVLYPTAENQLGFLLNGKNFSYAPSANIGTQGPMTNALLSSIVPTVTLTPRTDYTGYACVGYQLFDMSSGYVIASTSYINVRIDPPARLYIPTLTASSGSTSLNPIELASENKTALIIGLSVTFGVILLALLAFFGYKKYKGSRDAADFHTTMNEDEPSISQTANAAGGDAGGPTRRFYYDASKV